MKKLLSLILVLSLLGCSNKTSQTSTQPTLEDALEKISSYEFDLSNGLHTLYVLNGSTEKGTSRNPIIENIVVRNDYIYPVNNENCVLFTSVYMYEPINYDYSGLSIIIPDGIDEIIEDSENFISAYYSYYNDGSLVKDAINAKFTDVLNNESDLCYSDGSATVTMPSDLMDSITSQIAYSPKVTMQQNHITIQYENPDLECNVQDEFFISEDQIKQIIVKYFYNTSFEEEDLIYTITYTTTLPDCKDTYARLQSCAFHTNSSYELQLNQEDIEITEKEVTLSDLYELLTSYKPFDDSKQWGQFTYNNPSESDSIYTNNCYYYFNNDGSFGEFSTTYRYSKDSKEITEYYLNIPIISNNPDSNGDYMFVSSQYSATNTAPEITFESQNECIVTDEEICENNFENHLTNNFKRSSIELYDCEITDETITVRLYQHDNSYNPYTKLVYTIKDGAIYEYTIYNYTKNFDNSNLERIEYYTPYIHTYQAMSERCNKLINGGTLEDTLQYNYFKDLLN